MTHVALTSQTNIIFNYLKEFRSDADRHSSNYENVFLPIGFDSVPTGSVLKISK